MKDRHRSTRAGALAMALGFGAPLLGCVGLGHAQESGSGVERKEPRPVPEFTEVEVSSALQADVAAGAATQVEISGDDNLVPLVIAEVRGQRLVLRTRSGQSLRPKLPLRVRIRAPRLHAIAATGAARVSAAGVSGPTASVSATGAAQLTATELRADRVVVNASGASEVRLAGQGKDLSVELSGASHLYARELPVGSARIEGSGASGGAVCASAAVHASLSGASQLEAFCKPASVTKSLSGASAFSLP